MSNSRIVHALLQGMEESEKVSLLLELTNINSEALKTALLDHLVKGTPARMIPIIHDVKQQNFSRGLKRLNEVYSIVCHLNNIS